MSESILLEGKKGHGKSLVQVKLMRQYLSQGRMVATNLNLYMEHLMPPLSRAVAIRLPDFPAARDLEMIGISTASIVAAKEGWQAADNQTEAMRKSQQPDTKLRDKFQLTDEDLYGLLNLDEVGSFLNSRNWQGSDRQAVVSYLSQCRKYGWDCLLSAQHHKMVDAQIRTALCDIRGIAKRLDKIAVPFLSGIYKHFTGRRLRLPKIHIANFFYGFEKGSPLSWREVYTGSDVWNGYDTTQKISGEFGNQYAFCYLSAWHLKGRYMTPMQLYGRVATLSLMAGLVVGIAVGVLIGGGGPGERPEVVELATVSSDVYVKGFMNDGNRMSVMLSNGRVHSASAYHLGRENRFRVGDVWYGEQKK